MHSSTASNMSIIPYIIHTCCSIKLKNLSIMNKFSEHVQTTKQNDNLTGPSKGEREAPSRRCRRHLPKPQPMPPCRHEGGIDQYHHVLERPGGSMKEVVHVSLFVHDAVTLEFAKKKRSCRESVGRFSFKMRVFHVAWH